jgi:hypothetical protein
MHEQNMPHHGLHSPAMLQNEADPRRHPFRSSYVVETEVGELVCRVAHRA